MKTEPNDPAFNQNAEIGINKREYFAAMAMQGLLINAMEFGRTHETEISRQAVLYADALIAELNK